MKRNVPRHPLGQPKGAKAPKRHPKSIEKSITFERAVRHRSGSARRAFWSAFVPILGRSGGPFSTFFALFSESGEVENSMYFIYYRRGRTSENPSKSGRKSRWKTGPATHCPFEAAGAPRSLPRAPKREPKEVENGCKNWSKKDWKKSRKNILVLLFCKFCKFCPHFQRILTSKLRSHFICLGFWGFDFQNRSGKSKNTISK